MSLEKQGPAWEVLLDLGCWVPAMQQVALGALVVMWYGERELDDQWTNPWWAYAFQCLQLLHLPSSWRSVSSSPIARTQRPLFGRAARPTASDCFSFQSNNVFSAVASHQLQVTSALSSSAGGETQTLLGSDSIQHCSTAVLPLSVPQQISLDVKPRLLAQTHPLELLFYYPIRRQSAARPSLLLQLLTSLDTAILLQKIKGVFPLYYPAAVC